MRVTVGSGPAALELRDDLLDEARFELARDQLVNLADLDFESLRGKVDPG